MNFLSSFGPDLEKTCYRSFEEIDKFSPIICKLDDFDLQKLEQSREREDRYQSEKKKN